MLDINVHVGGWAAHIALRRVPSEVTMDWNERASKRVAARGAYRDSVKDNADALARFLVPTCFAEIAKQVAEELKQCPCNVVLAADFEKHSFRLEKPDYPHAELRLKIDKRMPQITCTTTGLGADNEGSATTVEYMIRVNDGKVAYRKLSDVGAASIKFTTVNDLVDDILTPFADCIAV